MIHAITRLVRHIFPIENRLLNGRWAIDYEDHRLDRKLYLTHMDHCGCCGVISPNVSKIPSSEEELLLYYLIGY